MRKRKKQLLGLVGLVLVGVITAVACAMPMPGASAAEDAKSASVGIKVTVNESEDPGPSTGKTSVSVVAINNEGTSAGQIITVNSKLRFKIAYRRADEVSVKVTGADGQVATAKCQSVSYSSSEQTCMAEVTLDRKYLAKDPENGDKFLVTAMATRLGTGTTVDDAVEFIYRSAYIYSKGEVEDVTNNPIVYAVMNSDVKYAMLQVFDANGKAVLAQPLSFSYADVDPATGLYKIVLPMRANNLPAGKYTVVLMAYSTDKPSEEGLISISTIKNVVYSPDGGPLPPDTGNRLFENLNISQADYIVTGLVAFGMVTAFAVFLILRRNKR